MREAKESKAKANQFLPTTQTIMSHNYKKPFSHRLTEPPTRYTLCRFVTGSVCRMVIPSLCYNEQACNMANTFAY